MRNRLDPPTATGGEDMKALDKFVEAKKAGGPNFGVILEDVGSGGVSKHKRPRG